MALGHILFFFNFLIKFCHLKVDSFWLTIWDLSDVPWISSGDIVGNGSSPCTHLAPCLSQTMAGAELVKLSSLFLAPLWAKEPDMMSIIRPNTWLTRTQSYSDRFSHHSYLNNMPIKWSIVFWEEKHLYK